MRTSLRQWIKNYDAGQYDSKDVDVQVEAGWYDWFCADKSLRNRLRKLAPKVKQIAKSPKIDPDTVYVFFKNNQPYVGKLYDDFRICDLLTHQVIYTIIPRTGFQHEPGEFAEVWGKENEFEEPLRVGQWRDIRDFFDV